MGGASSAQDWGWGIVVAVTKDARADPALVAAHPAHGYIVDMLLNCAPGSVGGAPGTRALPAWPALPSDG